jgi:hypothetical protein
MLSSWPYSVCTAAIGVSTGARLSDGVSTTAAGGRKPRVPQVDVDALGKAVPLALVVEPHAGQQVGRECSGVRPVVCVRSRAR